jgi:hypothetical protein
MMHKLPMRDEGVFYYQRRDINYTEAKERSPMDVRVSHCCLLLHVNQPKVVNIISCLSAPTFV